jgi:hypothetical protein
VSDESGKARAPIEARRLPSSRLLVVEERIREAEAEGVPGARGVDRTLPALRILIYAEVTRSPRPSPGR